MCDPYNIFNMLLKVVRSWRKEGKVKAFEVKSKVPLYLFKGNAFSHFIYEIQNDLQVNIYFIKL